MKNTCPKIALMLLVCGAVFNASASTVYTDIGSFSSGNFTVDPESGYAPSQSSSGLTTSMTVSAGDGFYGTFTVAPKNWSSYTSFALLMSSTVSSAVPFTVYFQDSTAAIAAEYTGTTAGITSTAASNLLTYVNKTYSGSLSDITYISFGWDGGGNVSSTTLVGIQGIPEPSTGAMMLLGGLGLMALRRLRKV